MIVDSPGVDLVQEGTQRCKCCPEDRRTIVEYMDVIDVLWKHGKAPTSSLAEVAAHHVKHQGGTTHAPRNAQTIKVFLTAHLQQGIGKNRGDDADDTLILLVAAVCTGQHGRGRLP